MRPDCDDVAGSMVKEFTTPFVAAKHGTPWNVGFEESETVPDDCPGAGGGLKSIVAFTGESNAMLLLASAPASEPEAEPDESGGTNVAMKVPGFDCVAELHSDASPSG
ncbi:MAG TPA: hypothetical protein VJN21_11425 [Candidatus Acidoferrales bacterium]|nr:hypothetical protein [Candidatus Acidoferrales bacterium]